MGPEKSEDERSLLDELRQLPVNEDFVRLYFTMCRARDEEAHPVLTGGLSAEEVMAYVREQGRWPGGKQASA